MLQSGLHDRVAVSGEDALERFRSAEDGGTPFDIAILDLTVPGGMGGAEAVHHIRRIRSDVLVFVTSGYADDAVLARFQGADSTASFRSRSPYRTCGALWRSADLHEQQRLRDLSISSCVVSGSRTRCRPRNRRCGENLYCSTVLRPRRHARRRCQRASACG